MITFDIDVSTVLARVRSFERRSVPRLMKTLGALVEGQTKRRFTAEKTAPDGTPWKALAPLTVKQRRKRSKSILVNTARLRNSIADTVGSKFVIVGTNVQYAGYHQSGTRRMVARPFLGISDKNRDEIRMAVEAWAQREFGA